MGGNCSISFALGLWSVLLVCHIAIIHADDRPPSKEEMAVDPALNKRLTDLVDKHKIPGIVAGVVRGDKLIAVGAAGVRKSGSLELMTVNDRMHLGSCTKAMTATRIAMLVEERKLSWDSTLSAIFLDEIADVHPDYHEVTLTQMLTHRASFPANGPLNDLGIPDSTPQQRLAVLRKVLKRAPRLKPGSKFQYSNVGYALAGAMAEKVTGQSWEDLMREGLFRPLEMSSAGYGPPGTAGTVDEPWGHVSLLGIVKPIQHDNPAWMGPAGTVHASIPDWAKFATMHLQGARGESQLLQHDSFLRLQTPPPDANYAMGWLVSTPDKVNGRVLAHDGSNTMWYCSITIVPERNLALLVAINSADGAAQAACNEAVRSLFDDFNLDPSNH